MGESVKKETRFLVTEEVESGEKERGRHFRGIALRKGDRESERRERKGKGRGRCANKKRDGK